VIDAQELAERYAAIWNLADDAKRREAVLELWTTDAVHHLLPPQEVRDRAAALGVTAEFRAVGHAELENRVKVSYEEFVAPGTYVFRAADGAHRIGNVVSFGWQAIRAESGEPEGGGREVVILAEDGRIVTDYQFPG
jgi:hypothetical protein